MTAKTYTNVTKTIITHVKSNAIHPLLFLQKIFYHQIEVISITF